MKYHQKYGRWGKFDDMLFRYCNAMYNQNMIDRWTKDCTLPFPKMGDLGIAKNYRGITLTSIAAKIYSVLLPYRIGPKIDKTLRKNQNGFFSNFWRCSRKKPRGNTIIWRLLQGIWLYTQREDGANTRRRQSPQRNRHSHNPIYQLIRSGRIWHKVNF